ncbi:rho-related GTP-binding protein RhoE-like [Liolophura sinensis]|uniref:rho-related GTP-binding protein RhoE-like n=1 Tax=Liolophura sinensis TaxID=3198878 RepID=UPI0031590AFC
MYGETTDPSVTCVQTKIVIVGDCNCGKTTLINRYIKGEYLEKYTPTGFDTYTGTYKVSSTYRIKMSIWDTSGDSGYDRVRPLSYTDADLVLVCFSIGDPDSVENVKTKWHPEIREYCPNQPIMLIGCKSDLRTDTSTISKLEKTKQTVLSYDQGLSLAKQIGALVYSETSAKSCPRSVTDVLEVAALSSAGTRHTPTFKRQRSFIRRKRFSGVQDAQLQLRKEAVKSCSVM